MNQIGMAPGALGKKGLATDIKGRNREIPSYGK
jgi:hypothetical protein